MYFGHEKIKGLEDTRIKDFWQWTYSDLLISKNRDDVGLFLVANALDLTRMPRINWGKIDLRYRKKKIAVRTSGYIQSWKQKKPKRISFDISPKKGIDAKKEDSMTFRNRDAEIYIFCVLVEKDVKKIDILNLEQWNFYIVRASTLDEYYPNNKKLSIRPLKQLAGPLKQDRIKANLDILIDLELTEKMVL